MASSTNRFVPIALLIGGASLVAPGNAFARGGASGGSHIQTHPVASSQTGGATIHYSSGTSSNMLTVQNVKNNAIVTGNTAGGSRHPTAPTGADSKTSNVVLAGSKPIVNTLDAGNVIGGGYHPRSKLPRDGRLPIVDSAQVTAPGKNVMDLSYDLRDPFGSVARDPLGVLNEGINSFVNGPSTNGAEENSKAGALTNGSQGQYQDGAPMNYPSKPQSSSSTPAAPPKKAPVKLYGQLSNQSETNAKLANYSSLKKTDYATVSNSGQNLVGKTSGSTSQTGGVNPPTNPTKPTPTTTKPYPMPYPLGPVYVGGSDDAATPLPTTVGTTPVAADGPATIPTAPLGADLVLEDVQLASPATLVAGPAYTVQFRNQGTEQADKFQVGIFAGLGGAITNDAPRAVVEVASLAAGEVKTVTLRLPQASLKLIGSDNKPVAFTHLFVAVDLRNAVPETDKTNNTAVVERAAVELAASK